jgi:hypothetical protein
MNSLLAQTIIAYLLIFAVPMLLPVVFLKVVGLSGLRTLVTYEARDTALHKLDPRLKVLYPIGMGILSILFTWKFMLIVFGLTILPWFWLRPSRAKIKVLMVMIIGPAIAGFWGQGLYYLPPPPIHFLYKFPWTMAWLGSPGITSYGMIFGLQQTSRVLVTVSTSMLILVSTDVGDFTWAFERFRAPPHVGERAGVIAGAPDLDHPCAGVVDAGDPAQTARRQLFPGVGVSDGGGELLPAEGLIPLELDKCAKRHPSPPSSGHAAWQRYPPGARHRGRAASRGAPVGHG